MHGENCNMLSKEKINNLKNQLRKAYITFLNKDIISNIKYIFIIFFIIVFNYHFEYIEIDI